MYARVTLLEIDTLRVEMNDALEVYRTEVLPELHKQAGYQGGLVLTTPEGKGMVVSFWETEEQADSHGESGFYPDMLQSYVTLFRSPPGRDHYEVSFLALPVSTHG